MHRYFATFVALMFSLAALGGAGVREIKPTVTGDGAAGDSFGVRTALCGSEVLISAMGDVLPDAEIANGRAQGSVYRFAQAGSALARGGKLTAVNGADGDLFGFALACDTQVLLISARDADAPPQVDNGAVYIYEKVANGWLARGELAGSRLVPEARFGSALALSAQWLLVGAPGESAVYAYARNGLSFGAPRRISVADLALNSAFGSALLISNPAGFVAGAPGAGKVVKLSTAGVELARLSGPSSFGASLRQIDTELLIGAPLADGGVVTIYGLSLLDLRQTIVAPDQGSSDRFGTALSPVGSALAISAVGTSAGDGSVYVFERAGNAFWRLARALRRNTGPGSDLFGVDLLDDAGRLLVGAQFALAADHPGQGLVWRFSSDFASAAPVDSGEGAALERFGQAIATDQQRLIVGSFLADTSAGVDSGVAEIFQRTPSGWVLEATLKPNDALAEQRFGISVALSGERALVGSYWDVVNGVIDAGSAYLFERRNGTWQQVQKLISPEPRTRAYFGFSVALSGTRALVGARGDSAPSTEQGSVVFFQLRDRAFAASKVIRPADSRPFDAFGASVSLRENTALIGAPGASRPDCLCGGRAYVMRAMPDRNDWQFTQTLRDEQGGASNGFGFSVALSTSLQALVGIPFGKGGPIDGAGSALLFAPQGPLPIASWGLPTRLVAPNPAAGDGFGIAVAMHDAGALVGASGTDAGNTRDIGAAYYFQAGSAQQFAVTPVIARAALGRSVAIFGSRALAGAPAVPRDNPQEGAVYEFLGDELFANGFE